MAVTRNLVFRNIFHTLVMAAMVGCIALSVVDLVRMFAPAWDGTLLLIGSVLAALEAPYAYRLIQARRLSGWEVWRFRAVEYGFFFLVLRFGHYLGQSLPAVLTDIQSWPGDPARFFDLPTSLSFLLLVLISFAVTESVQDFERLSEPLIRVKGEVSPVESLTGRFFWGGGLLLVASGLARLGFASLLELERPPLPGLVLNVLIYFMLGLVMMGQINFDRMNNLWRQEGIPVADNLGQRWARYSLALLGLAALLAFLLPTSYSFGALGFIGYGLYVLLSALMFVLGLLMWPIIWLLAALLRLAGLRSPTLPRTTPQVLPSQSQLFGTSATWLDVVRTVLMVTILTGMILYVVVSYVREHPELLRALKAFGPFKAVRRWLTGLGSRVGGWARAANDRIPRAWLRRWLNRASARAQFSFFRLSGASPREQVLYYYLSVLRRAGEQGFPRRSAQTPAEYRATLAAHLPEVQDEVDALTGAFVAARYSSHPVTTDRALQVRLVWERVRATLRALRRGQPASAPNPARLTDSDHQADQRTTK